MPCHVSWKVIIYVCTPYIYIYTFLFSYPTRILSLQLSGLSAVTRVHPIAPSVADFDFFLSLNEILDVFPSSLMTKRLPRPDATGNSTTS